MHKLTLRPFQQFIVDDAPLRWRDGVFPYYLVARGDGTTTALAALAQHVGEDVLYRGPGPYALSLFRARGVNASHAHVGLVREHPSKLVILDSPEAWRDADSRDFVVQLRRLGCTRVVLAGSPQFEDPFWRGMVVASFCFSRAKMRSVALTKTGMQFEASFDETRLMPSTWQTLLNRGGLRYVGVVELRGLLVHEWASKTAVVHTWCNPLTGEYVGPGTRDIDLGFASKVGISACTAEERDSIVTGIEVLADYTKGVDRGARSYI